MAKSRQDHDNQSFEAISGSESARRVLVKSGLEIPRHTKGIGVETSSTIETYTFYREAVLVGTLVVKYSDSSKMFMTEWELTTP